MLKNALLHTRHAPFERGKTIKLNCAHITYSFYYVTPQLTFEPRSLPRSDYRPHLATQGRDKSQDDEDDIGLLVLPWFFLSSLPQSDLDGGGGRPRAYIASICGRGRIHSSGSANGHTTIYI